MELRIKLFWVVSYELSEVEFQNDALKTDFEAVFSELSNLLPT